MMSDKRSDILCRRMKEGRGGWGPVVQKRMQETCWKATIKKEAFRRCCVPLNNGLGGLGCEQSKP